MSEGSLSVETSSQDVECPIQNGTSSSKEEEPVDSHTIQDTIEAAGRAGNKLGTSQQNGSSNDSGLNMVVSETSGLSESYCDSDEKNVELFVNPEQESADTPSPCLNTSPEPNDTRPVHDIPLNTLPTLQAPHVPKSLVTNLVKRVSNQLSHLSYSMPSKLSHSLPTLVNQTVDSVPCTAVQSTPQTNGHAADKALSLDELTERLLLESSTRESLPSSSSGQPSPLTSSPASTAKLEHESSGNVSTSSFCGLNGVSISSHPAYRTAIQELLLSKEQVGNLQDQLDRLEQERQTLLADRSPEIFRLQLETLERTVEQQQRQLEEAASEAEKQEHAAVAAIASAKMQLDKVMRDYAEADRERQATVVRYAVSEREREKGRQDMQNLEKRLLEAGREKDALFNKLKSAAADKARACQALDTKIAEITYQTREMEKLKDELNSRDIKIKWAQNKIRQEMDANKESQQKAERLGLRLESAREEIETIKRECQAVVKSCQQGREDRAQVLELQTQEQKAQLIAERHARQDAEEAKKAALSEAEQARARQQQLLDENNVLCQRVQQLERERLEAEQRVSTFQSSEERRCQLEADVEALTLQLQQQENRAAASQAEVERLRQSSADLAQDAAACREKEAELLAYTQKLTDKVVRLQSESSALEARAQLVEAEREPLTRQVAQLEQRLAESEAALEAERAARLEESRLLARRLAERQEWGERLAGQLEEARGECAVLKRKQAQATKELTREVQQCMRKLQQAEGGGACSLSQSSRSGSQSSLNEIPAPSMLPPPPRDTPQPTTVQPPQSGAPLDPQLLISRIGKLQSNAARQQEKLDFLEEHNRTLLAEVQRKARLVQGLVLREEAGALASRASDRTKAELVRHGGVMASLYSAAPADEGMTLELSLEINRKLQAVLEDTLLKNITLKENMDTLGKEIERLSAQLTRSSHHQGPRPSS